MPFLNPSGFKGFLGRLRDLDDAVLRRAGGFSMAAGVLLIYFVR